MVLRHNRIFGSFLLIIIGGFGLALLWQVPARTNQVFATGTPPVELAVFPDKIWRAGTTNTQLVVGLKGNGYTGPVTVDIAGLPKASGDGIDGFVQCDSNCAPAGVGLGRPPFTVSVIDGQWKMFAPSVYPPIDNTTEYTDQTYTLTVTATVTGYTSLTKTATLFAEHPYSQSPPQVYHQPGVPACASINDGASQPIRPANKLSVTAGGSVTFTCSWRAPEKSNYLQNQWVDGTSLTFISTHNSANPLYEPTITGTFSRASAPFDKPSPPQCGGTPYNCTFDTSKDVVVDYTVQTSASTPAGVYVFAFGSKNATGYYRVAPEGVLTVTESVSSPTLTPSPSPSATSAATATPSASGSTQVLSTPSSVTTSTSQPSGASSPSSLPSLGPVVSPTPSSTATPTSSSSATPSTQYHQSMIVSGVVTDAEGIALPFAQVTFAGASSTTDQYGYYVVSTNRFNDRAEAQRLTETLHVSAPLFPRPETTVTTELPYDLTQRDTSYTKDIQLPPSTGPQLYFKPNPATAGEQITVTATGFPPNQTLYLFMNPYIVETKRESDGTRYLRQTGLFDNSVWTGGTTKFPTPQTDATGAATFAITAPRALNKKLTMIATATLEAVIAASQDEQRFAPLTATTGIGGVLPASVGAMKILQTNYTLRPGETQVKVVKQQLTDLGFAQLPAAVTSSLIAAALAPEAIGNHARAGTIEPAVNATLVANPSVTLSLGGTSATSCQLADATPNIFLIIRRAVAQSKADLCSGNRQQTFAFINSSDPRKYGNSLAILQGMGFWLSQLQTILSQPTLSPEQRTQVTSDLSLVQTALRLIETNYLTQETQVIVPQLQSRVRQVVTQFQNHPANQQPLPTQATYQPQTRLEWRLVPGVVISTQYTGSNKFANETITTVVDRQKYRSNLSPAVVSPYLDTFLFNSGGGSVIVTVQLPDGQTITSPPLKNQSNWTQFIQNQKLFGPNGQAILHGFIDEDGQFKTLAEAEAQWRRVVELVEGGAFELSARLQRLTNFNPIAFLDNREVILKTKGEGLNLVGVKLGAAYVIFRGSSLTNDFYSCPKNGISVRYPMIGYYLQNDRVTDRIPPDRIYSPIFCGDSLAQAQDKAVAWLKGQKENDHYEVTHETIGSIEQYERGQYLKELAALQAEFAVVERELMDASHSRGYEVVGLTRSLGTASDFGQIAHRGKPWFPPVLAAEADVISDTAAGDESALLQTQETNYLRVAFQGVPALLTVTDPLGRTIGTHPLTNLSLAQIPDAVVGGSGTPHTTVFLPQVVKGKYTLMITPLADGEGTLWTESSIGGSEPTQSIVSKTVQAKRPEIGNLTIDFDTQSAVSSGLRLRNYVLFSYHKAPIIWWGSGLVLLLLVFLRIRKSFAGHHRRPTQA